MAENVGTEPTKRAIAGAAGQIGHVGIEASGKVVDDRGHRWPIAINAVSTRLRVKALCVFRKALIEKDRSIILRAIGREESEMVRYANAIPPIASIDNLTAIEMLGLADMFEGWAQDARGRVDLIDMAGLLGRADGLRSLESRRSELITSRPSHRLMLVPPF
jgi:hypothetical protein